MRHYPVLHAVAARPHPVIFGVLLSLNERVAITIFATNVLLIWFLVSIEMTFIRVTAHTFPLIAEL
jgi:hypothetical protein